ncbi:MAG: TetR family transcriptional regulator [Pseudonocardiaceae bacterium]
MGRPYRCRSRCRGRASEHGMRSVTMSQIAEETGIGRATLAAVAGGRR